MTSPCRHLKDYFFTMSYDSDSVAAKLGFNKHSFAYTSRKDDRRSSMLFNPTVAITITVSSEQLQTNEISEN